MWVFREEENEKRRKSHLPISLCVNTSPPNRRPSAKMSAFSRLSIASRFSALSDSARVFRCSETSRSTNGRPEMYTVIMKYYGIRMGRCGSRCYSPIGSSRVENHTTCPPSVLPGLHCNTERIARRPCVRGCAQPYTFRLVALLALAESGPDPLANGEAVRFGDEDKPKEGEPAP